MTKSGIISSLSMNHDSIVRNQTISHDFMKEEKVLKKDIKIRLANVKLNFSKEHGFYVIDMVMNECKLNLKHYGKAI
jgi:hypothetical protein